MVKMYHLPRPHPRQMFAGSMALRGAVLAIPEPQSNQNESPETMVPSLSDIIFKVSSGTLGTQAESVNFV